MTKKKKPSFTEEVVSNVFWHDKSCSLSTVFREFCHEAFRCLDAVHLGVD